MNEKVENLILEHLRALRSEAASTGEEIRGIRSEMRAMKLQLERIGKRLDIVE